MKIKRRHIKPLSDVVFEMELPQNLHYLPQKKKKQYVQRDKNTKDNYYFTFINYILFYVI